MTVEDQESPSKKQGQDDESTTKNQDKEERPSFVEPCGTIDANEEIDITKSMK